MPQLKPGAGPRGHPVREHGPPGSPGLRRRESNTGLRDQTRRSPVLEAGGRREGSRGRQASPRGPNRSACPGKAEGVRGGRPGGLRGASSLPWERTQPFLRPWPAASASALGSTGTAATQVPGRAQLRPRPGAGAAAEAKGQCLPYSEGPPGPCRPPPPPPPTSPPLSLCPEGPSRGRPQQAFPRGAPCLLRLLGPTQGRPRLWPGSCPRACPPLWALPLPHLHGPGSPSDAQGLSRKCSSSREHSVLSLPSARPAQAWSQGSGNWRCRGQVCVCGVGGGQRAGQAPNPPRAGQEGSAGMHTSPPTQEGREELAHYTDESKGQEKAPAQHL